MALRPAPPERLLEGQRIGVARDAAFAFLYPANLDLLRDLRERFELSILFITHDLRVAAQLCDRIAVMHRGMLGPARPVSACTESSLMSEAVLGPDGAREEEAA